MALLTTGNAFIRELEKVGSLGVYVPPEGVMKVGTVADCAQLGMKPSTLRLRD